MDVEEIHNTSGVCGTPRNYRETDSSVPALDQHHSRLMTFRISRPASVMRQTTRLAAERR